jgi:hypothetical protein
VLPAGEIAKPDSAYKTLNFLEEQGLSGGAGILEARMWMYFALAVGAAVLLKFLASIVVATERIGVRSERRDNRDLRERLERYSAR